MKKLLQTKLLDKSDYKYALHGALFATVVCIIIMVLWEVAIYNALELGEMVSWHFWAFLPFYMIVLSPLWFLLSTLALITLILKDKGSLRNFIINLFISPLIFVYGGIFYILVFALLAPLVRL